MISNSVFASEIFGSITFFWHLILFHAEFISLIWCKCFPWLVFYVCLVLGDTIKPVDRAQNNTKRGFCNERISMGCSRVISLLDWKIFTPVLGNSGSILSKCKKSMFDYHSGNWGPWKPSGTINRICNLCPSFPTLQIPGPYVHQIYVYGGNHFFFCAKSRPSNSVTVVHNNRPSFQELPLSPLAAGYQWLLVVHENQW